MGARKTTILGPPPRFAAVAVLPPGPPARGGTGRAWGKKSFDSPLNSFAVTDFPANPQAETPAAELRATPDPPRGTLSASAAAVN